MLDDRFDSGVARRAQPFRHAPADLGAELPAEVARALAARGRQKRGECVGRHEHALGRAGNFDAAAAEVERDGACGIEARRGHEAPDERRADQV
jgi:hypothetical protein